MNSIAMCTYNGEKYIREQLESIIGQTLPPDEIVICDDCSKDHTIQVVRDTLKNWDGRWTLVCNEKNLGYKKNFEKAISLCHGDIIYLSDQDDVWDIHKIEIMNEVFRQHPEVVTAWHDAELVGPKLEPLYPSFWKNTLFFDYEKFMKGDYSHVWWGNVMQGSACAFRREVFEAARPFPMEAVHDEWLLLISLLLGEVLPVPKVLMKYRQADNTLGGMPVSLKTKIGWLKRWQANVKRVLDEMRRRAFVFHELTNKNISGERMDVRRQYDFCYRFLSYRLQGIERRNPGLLFHLPEYRRTAYSGVRAFALLVRDYTCML